MMFYINNETLLRCEVSHFGADMTDVCWRLKKKTKLGLVMLRYSTCHVPPFVESMVSAFFLLLEVNNFLLKARLGYFTV